MFNFFQIKYLFVIGLCLFTSFITAQLTFETKVNKTRITEHERLRVEFTANFDGDYFEEPHFGSLNTFGPSTSISQSWINGRSTFNKSYIYIIEPTKTGKFTIGSASIEYKGEIYKTKPIVIEVVKGDPNQNQNPYYNQNQQLQQQKQIDVDDEIQLIAEISKTNPFVNEPITVVYKLYFSHSIGIQDFAELNKPKYNNFWNHHFEIKQLQPVEDTYNGKKTRSVILKKVVLYPQKDGALEIEPLSYKTVLQMPTGRRDFLGRMDYTTQEKVISAGKKTINVKPLPLQNQPEDFTGAVGHFDFKVIPSRTALKAGESLEIKVHVTGTGNLKLFKLPELKFPNAFEVYDPVNKQNITTPLSGMTGSTVDTYTIIPQSKGNYTIKTTTFSYFDLKSNSYKTITSEVFEIIVTDGDGLIANNETESDGNKTAVVSAEQFKFINLKTKFVDANKSDFLGSTGHLLSLLLSLAFIPLLVFIKRRRDVHAADIVGNRIKANQRLAKKYLKEAQNKLNQKDLFYDALERSLHKYLKAKLRIETTEMSKEHIGDLLTQKQFDQIDIGYYISLLESIEYARYAPSTEAKMQEDYELAVSTIANFEKSKA